MASGFGDHSRIQRQLDEQYAPHECANAGVHPWADHVADKRPADIRFLERCLNSRMRFPFKDSGFELLQEIARIEGRPAWDRGCKAR